MTLGRYPRPPGVRGHAVTILPYGSPLTGADVFMGHGRKVYVSTEPPQPRIPFTPATRGR